MEVPFLTSTPTRIPAALWEAMQEICWRHDNKFLEDAARIINVPAAEIRRRVLGTRGVVSAVVSSSGAWFDGTQCPLMIPCGGEMWRRCCEPAECNGFCWAHKKGKGPRHDSEYMKGLEVRNGWRLDSEIVWVDSEGVVYDSLGKILKGVHFEKTNGVFHDARPSPPPWTREELAQGQSEDAGSDSESD